MNNIKLEIGDILIDEYKDCVGMIINIKTLSPSYDKEIYIKWIPYIRSSWLYIHSESHIIENVKNGNLIHQKVKPPILTSSSI